MTRKEEVVNNLKLISDLLKNSKKLIGEEFEFQLRLYKEYKLPFMTCKWGLDFIYDLSIKLFNNRIETVQDKIDLYKLYKQNLEGDFKRVLDDLKLSVDRLEGVYNFLLTGYERFELPYMTCEWGMERMYEAVLDEFDIKILYVEKIIKWNVEDEEDDEE